MKKNLVIMTLIGFMLTSGSSFAWTSNEQFTSEEYMLNYGNSQVVADTVRQQKAKANGEAIEKDPYKVNWWRKYVLDYIDPARSRHDFNSHDIKPVSSFSDF